MKFLATFLAIFIHAGVHAQSISGRVVDASTGAPLEYVNVRIAGKNKGTVTTSRGEYKLDVSGVDAGDTVRFSYIGYGSLSRTVASLRSTSAQLIKLTPQPLLLKELEITTKSQTRILGNARISGRYTGWGDFESLRGRIRGLLIHDSACPVKVKSVAFRINHNEWDSVAFRVNFLQLKDGKAGESVLNQNIFVTTSSRRKWVRVDLDSRNIVICGSVVITLEWIDAWGVIGEYSNQLTLSLAKNSGVMYIQEPGEESGTLATEDYTPAITLEVYGD